MSEPTEALLERCRQGDGQAFAQLVAEQQDYIYTLARRILLDPEEAADLTQEVLLQVWRGLPAFRGGSRFRTWLYRIVVNRGLNRLRRRRREGESVPLEQARESGRLPAGGEDPYTHAWKEERRRTLWEKVHELPPRYRIVLSLFYQQDLSCAEIAQVLGIPLGTVKTYLHRARKALAEAWPQGGEDAL